MAKTQRINLSLPTKLYEYVQAQGASGHFHSEADFIRYAIRKVQELERGQNPVDFDLDAFIQAGIESGPSKRSGKEIFERVHAGIDEIAQKKVSNSK